MGLGLGLGLGLGVGVGVCVPVNGANRVVSHTRCRSSNNSCSYNLYEIFRNSIAKQESSKNRTFDTSRRLYEYKQVKSEESRPRFASRDQSPAAGRVQVKSEALRNCAPKLCKIRRTDHALPRSVVRLIVWPLFQLLVIHLPSIRYITLSR